MFKEAEVQVHLLDKKIKMSSHEICGVIVTLIGTDVKIEAGSPPNADILPSQDMIMIGKIFTETNKKETEVTDVKIVTVRTTEIREMKRGVQDEILFLKIKEVIVKAGNIINWSIIKYPYVNVICISSFFYGKATSFFF